MSNRWLLLALLLLLGLTLYMDRGSPYAAAELDALPGSSLCCPQGAVPMCWCAPDVRALPPCEPPATLGTIPGVEGQWCRVTP